MRSLQPEHAISLGNAVPAILQASCKVGSPQPGEHSDFESSGLDGRRSGFGSHFRIASRSVLATTSTQRWKNVGTMHRPKPGSAPLSAWLVVPAEMRIAVDPVV